MNSQALEDEMRVLKRNGILEPVSFDKILHRIKTAGNGLKVNFTSLAMKVIDQLYDTISATKIDELSAEQCASMTSIHPDYNVLAGRIIISNHHKNTESSFKQVMHQLYQYRDKHGLHSPLISEELYLLSKDSPDIDDLCDYERDYLIDYFGFKTLERAYLIQIDKRVVERPQHMWLRVSIGIHGSITDSTIRFEKIKETYEYMSNKYFTHATPTLFNAGTPKPQLSSCYLLSMEEDSIEGIYNTLKDCALISKHAGGIGLHIHNIRATGSHIRGTNGTSNGIVPMLRVFNNTAKYVDQCITADSIIFTTDGPIEIASCVTNVTKVFGRTGQPETINKVLEYPHDGDLYVIESSMPGAVPIRITDEHPIYVLPNSVGNLNIVNDLKLGLLKPIWLEAKHVTEKDLLVYSTPKYEYDILMYTEEACFMYGILISNEIGFYGGYFKVTFASADEMKDVTDYFNKKCIDCIINDEENSLEWTTGPSLPFTRNDFFNYEGKKRVGKWWLFLPAIKTEKIVEGIYRNKELKDLTFCNIESIWWSLQRDCVGIRHDGLVYVPVKSVSKTHYKGSLYDLQLTVQHNYMTAMGIIHNGGGKRNGSFAIYLEPWHADIRAFLQMRKNHGDEEMKARDLFYALWIPDLFMERVKADGVWTLMCPDECPGLADVHSDEFRTLYERYERDGLGKETVKARDIWFEVLDAQMETGTPYLLYKDAANKKSNQKNLGTIKSSNLCVAPETVILTDQGHIKIQSLCDKTVNVWNGQEYSKVTVKKTGENQPIINVYTDDGLNMACTPYHKFYIQHESCISCLSQEIIVHAKDLKPGDKIIKCEYPIIDGTGLFLETENESVPSSNCPIEVKMEWFSMICKKIGTMNLNQLEIRRSNHDYLILIKYMLQTCGINPRIYTLYDGTSQSSNYDIAPFPIYSLCIAPYDIFKLTCIGFKYAEYDSSKEYEKYESTTSILKIEDKGRYADTYCFTEPKRHMGIFNGIITGQCTEIIEYSAPDETAVCNLASIALPAFIRPDNTIDYEELHKVAKMVTYNLNRIIDINYYPTEKTRNSNMRHRPIGIGVQGLADVFMILGHPFISEEAKEINRQIFETIYHGALECSMELAIVEGAYSTFAASPASNGLLQFDLWDIDPGVDRYDWPALKNQIKKYGLRNSLLLAPMPTASTSQILGYNECIEPITSNIYSRRTIAGEFIMANKYLMKDLMALELWNESTKNSIIANHGSIQHIDAIPIEIREKYKTVWELPMRQLIDMAADRGAYICQSQSLNLWLEDPNYGTLTSMHFYSWSKGLKTGIYYLRRRAKHQAQQFTIEPEKCEMCSS